MSEAADELERMAEEIIPDRDRSRLEAEKAAEQGLHTLSYGYRCIADVCDLMMGKLRGRAAELRTQRSGPLGTKPHKVESFQWWQRGPDAPVRVHAVSVARGDCEPYAYFRRDGTPVFSTSVSDLLSDPLWLYLGDGPEPAQNA